MISIAAGLARLIQQTGWDVVVEFDKEAPLGEFAVYLDNELVFSRLQERRLPPPDDIVPAIRTRLFGPEEEGHGAV